MGLKDTWKETGKGLGHSFRDLGKALVKTAAYAADKADDWANGEDAKPAPEATVETQAVEVEKPETKEN